MPCSVRAQTPYLRYLHPYLPIIQPAAPRKGISLTFKGLSYPDPASSEDTPQSFNANIYCDTEASDLDPTFKSYDGKDVWIEWQSPSGCAMGANEPGNPPDTNPDPPKTDPEDSRSVGSGIGYFFLL